MLDVGSRVSVEAATGQSPLAALDGVDAATVVLDDRGVIVHTNRAWIEAAKARGLSPGRAGVGSDYLAICDRAAAAGGEDAQIIAAMIRDMIAGDRDRFIAEYDCSHDGMTRWFEVRARRVDLARRPWIALTHVDVTERKAKETGDRLLIRELQHRLQNAVALISSLYSMSARRGGTIADLSVRFQARLQALAASYRLLDANGWHRVPLEQLAARVTGAVFAEGMVRLDGPPVMLVPSDTLNLALILHELCTNAVKHGALRHGRGRVSISWRFQDDHLVLIWQERGGPPVSLPRTAGVGSQVIDAAASNLDARVDRICHRSGLRVLIHMPRSSRSD